jgi:hypothetical protein
MGIADSFWRAPSCLQRPLFELDCEVAESDDRKHDLKVAVLPYLFRLQNLGPGSDRSGRGC